MNRRLSFLLIYLTVLVLAAIFSPLTDEDEGFCALVSKNMLLNHDFFRPMALGEWRADKPFFFFFLQSLGLKIWGFTSFGARFVPLIFSLATWVLMLKKQANFTLENHLNAAIVFYVGLNATQESTYFFFGLGQLLFFIDYILKGKNAIWLCIFSFFSALTKGPAMWALFVLCSILISSRTKPWKALLVISVANFVCFLFLWGFQPGFLEFIIDHNFQRFLNAKESHTGPVFYYLMIVVLGFFPFGFSFFKGFVLKLMKYKELGQSEEFIHVCWVLTVLVFYTLSKTKLPHYIFIASFSLAFLGQKSTSKFNSIWYILMIVGLQLSKFIDTQNALFAYLVQNTLLTQTISFIFFGYLVLNLLNQNRWAFLLHGLSFFVVTQAVYKPQSDFIQYVSTQKQAVIFENHYRPSVAFYTSENMIVGKAKKGFLFVGIQPKNGKLVWKQADLSVYSLE